VGLPDRPDYLEAYPLKLSPQHFPLPVSLYELVLQRYTGTPGEGEQVMTADKLKAYLKSIDDFNLEPLEAVLVQARANDDPSVPGAQHRAILQWLGTALADWEKSFPLEEPLASQLRRLKPLAAAMAITDKEFLTPGAHPLHQLLDTLQAGALGWQQSLGRAGVALQQQFASAIDHALAWFEDSSVDISTVCSDLAAHITRDQARADRMTQRTVETELGRNRTARARLDAALMINRALQEFRAPGAIGGFLKGPWFASAQLVLLKFGIDSQQWRQMTETTATLLESLQVPEDGKEHNRQHFFEVATQLPKELKGWLLTLQHDSEAMDDAVGAIEFAHLKILRQQPLELEQIQHLITADDVNNVPTITPPEIISQFDIGQWFYLDRGDDQALRMRLALKIDNEQMLLFTNRAGVKASRMEFEEFAQLTTANKLVPLHSGASFSACLTRAAGIDSEHSLATLLRTPDQADDGQTLPESA
jgi:hypothetical protein